MLIFQGCFPPSLVVKVEIDEMVVQSSQEFFPNSVFGPLGTRVDGDLFTESGIFPPKKIRMVYMYIFIYIYIYT